MLYSVSILEKPVRSSCLVESAIRTLSWTTSRAQPAKINKNPTKNELTGGLAQVHGLSKDVVWHKLQVPGCKNSMCNSPHLCAPVRPLFSRKVRDTQPSSQRAAGANLANRVLHPHLPLPPFRGSIHFLWPKHVPRTSVQLNFCC